MAWKRVYVPGKGWRYTDGKGNYKTSDPTRSRYRTPANDVVDAGTSAAKKGAKKAADTATKSVKATKTAAERTAEKEKAAQGQMLGYAARKKREKAVQQQPAAKPQSLTQRDNRIGNSDVRKLREAQNDAIKAYNKSKPIPTKPQSSDNQSGNSGSRTYASSSSKATTASVTEPKPIPKPASKVPSAKETYRDGGKGLYQGTEDYRAKVGGSGNPLLNRFRQDMGRDVATGMKTGGGNNNYNTPDQKSQYVASNGQPYAGPAFGEGKSSNSGKLAKAMEDQRKKREEERKRLMASRKGTSWGGVG